MRFKAQSTMSAFRYEFLVSGDLKVSQRAQSLQTCTARRHVCASELSPASALDFVQFEIEKEVASLSSVLRSVDLWMCSERVRCADCF